MAVTLGHSDSQSVNRLYTLQ